MGCDLFVALGPATAHGQTLFGLNCHGPAEAIALRRFPAGAHAPEENVRLPNVVLRQARETYNVLGCQVEGAWGCNYGINDHHVAMGCAGWRSRLGTLQGRLSGPALVLLTLQRSHSARQALDILTDLISRHGQGRDEPGGGPTDNIFLVADAHEAFVVEAAGSFWACLECPRLRAVTDAGMIRQDWQRLSPGLAAAVIDRGWWPDDGCKLDFGAALGRSGTEQAAAMKRWGRATLLLEEQSGHLDLPVLRRLLAEHHESASARPLAGPVGPAASMTTSLGQSGALPPLAWWSFGAPGALTLPILVEGELPPSYGPNHPDHLPGRLRLLQAEAEKPRNRGLRGALDLLQARIIQETEEFLAEARQYQQPGDRASLRRLAGMLMENHVELVEAEWRRWRGLPQPQPGREAAADILAFVAE